jgi:hypothetical protein
VPTSATQRVTQIWWLSPLSPVFRRDSAIRGCHLFPRPLFGDHFTDMSLNFVK